MDKTSSLSRHQPYTEIVLTGFAIVLTVIASAMAGLELSSILLEHLQEERWGTAVGHMVFILIIAFLVYGGFVYQFNRLSYLLRLRRHCPTSRSELEVIYESKAPALTVLVPTYKEEERIVFQTLMSAAFQDYPNRRIVLLIDDPPHAKTAIDEAHLASARSLPFQVQNLLDRPRRRFNESLEKFIERRRCHTINLSRETVRLANLYLEAAEWFKEEIDRFCASNHTEYLYSEKVLRWHQSAHTLHANNLLKRVQEGRTFLSEHDLLRDYRRLASLFTASITSFERKQYANLSHEANKAMNLNGYIGLVGNSYRKRKINGECYLEKASASDAVFSVPDADYFLTLDADSVIQPDYALRLLHIMEQPDNEKIAVAQTPYSAIPNAPSPLERVAGATTDIQYIIHQGFTGYDATYWVGANALLRKSALLDIAVTELERGFSVTRYIQDRTVIEDTESSIDLAARGWRLYNYPERLAYSATPPDFGSLLIQRRRWANGGLIILPKLLKYLLSTPKNHRTFAQGFMRIHYLVSIAAVNVGLLIILAVPFTDSIRSWWLPLTAVPYFTVYMRDLVTLGYRKTDMVRVYALNLLLIPVNLGGVLKSLQQAWNGTKIPFGRTPKVEGRTAASPVYILIPYVLAAYLFIEAGLDVSNGLLAHGIFAGLNASLLIYAISRFIGFRESKQDLLSGLRWNQNSTILVAAQSTPTAHEFREMTQEDTVVSPADMSDAA